MIYPKEITEVCLGTAEIEGYGCGKECFVVSGYIELTDRKIIYFDCPLGAQGDECKYLKEFLKGNPGVNIKKKRGNKDEIITDLVDAIEHSDLLKVKVPFRISTLEDQISPDKIEKFFIAFLDYQTELSDIKDDRFTITITRKIERRRPLKGLRDAIRKYFIKEK